MKPQLAEDAIIEKVQFPCIVQPKIDGVRAMNLNGTLTGRSLDPFAGFGITDYFSLKEFRWLDGEMTLGNDPASPHRLCSITTGAMGKFNGVKEVPNLHWWCFDYLPDPDLPYSARYTLLRAKIEELDHPRVHLVPMYEVNGPNELKRFIGEFGEQGYEGTIIRNPRSKHKSGRSTQEGQLWRVKPWSDFEILVTGITEGNTNTNEAKKNTLGRSKRSGVKAGMVPNGMVGSIQGLTIKDFKDPITGKLLFKRGTPVNAGTGEMTEVEAAWYFKNPHLIVNQIAKIKHMTHGVKDLPRFPTFLSLRMVPDMS